MAWPHESAWPLRKETPGMLARVLVLLDGSLTAAQIIPTLRQMLSGTGALVHLLGRVCKAVSWM